MKRKIVLKDGDFELILPVTPESYTVTAGVKIETVNIDGIGDVVFGGHGSLASVKIESFFPAQAAVVSLVKSSVVGPRPPVIISKPLYIRTHFNSFKNAPMRFSASARCLMEYAYEMRTKPSPHAPNAEPGTTATCLS